MSEDQVSDLRRRQFIRAECLLILSQILETPSIFDDARRRLDELAGIRAAGHDTSSGIGTLAGSSPSMSHKSNVDCNRPSSPLSVSSGVTEPSLLSEIEHDEAPRSRRPTVNPPGGWVVRSADTSNLSLHGSSSLKDRKRTAMGMSSSASNLIMDTVKPKMDRLQIKKKMFRPRASIMYGSNYETEKILPGEKDKGNWIEQDKKLGYQKSRMWYPVGGVNVDAHMLPKMRSVVNIASGGLASDQVVQEFLQMKALLSYVGDLVTFPRMSVPGASSASVSLSIAKGSGKIDSRLYNNTIRDALKYWDPLVGASLPAWAKPGPEISTITSSSSASTNESAFEDDANPYLETIRTPATSLGRQPKSGDPGRESIQKTVIWTKKILRKLLQKEIASKTKTQNTLKSTLDTLLSSQREGAEISVDTIRRIQSSLTKSIGKQRTGAEASSEGMQTLMRETVKLQYASLLPRYISVLEKRCRIAVAEYLPCITVQYSFFPSRTARKIPETWSVGCSENAGISLHGHGRVENITRTKVSQRFYSQVFQESRRPIDGKTHEGV